MEKAAERIEDLRVAWERDLEREFAGRPYMVIPDRDPGRHEPRVLLERAMAERVHQVADVEERPGVEEDVVGTGPDVHHQALHEADRHQALLAEQRALVPAVESGGVDHQQAGRGIDGFLAVRRVAGRGQVLVAAGHAAVMLNPRRP